MDEPSINDNQSKSQSRSKYPSSERRWILGFALVAMLVTTLPYLMGYGVQDETWRFTGFVFGVEDGNSYIAKMLRGAAGDWLFHTPYTASEQNGAFIFIHYLLLGKLTSFPGQHEQLVGLYHLFRITGGMLSILASYDFLALFLRNETSRKWGTVLITFGGGLGWLLVLVGKKIWLGNLPIDFYSPETFGFLGLFGIAHLPWARAFFLWGIRAYLLRAENIQPTPPATVPLANLHPGILWLLTGIAQPITGMVVGVIAAYHLIGLVGLQFVRRLRGTRPNWPEVYHATRVAITSGLIALPLVIYNFWAFTQDPFLTVWVEQSYIPAPHILHYLVAYGLIIPFAIIGAVVILRERMNRGIILVVWAAFTPLLLAIPFSLQRRLVEGLWIVLVALAFVACERINHKWFRWSYLVLVFCIPTTLFLISGSFLAAADPSTPAFRPADEVAAFNYLNENTDGEAVVLSSYETGNPMPAWAPVFVVIGHGPETAFLSEIEPRVTAFYQTTASDQLRWDLLTEFDVDYVFWGPSERELGNWKPDSVGYLSLVHQSGEFEIYQVNNANHSSELMLKEKAREPRPQPQAGEFWIFPVNLKSQ